MVEPNRLWCLRLEWLMKGERKGQILWIPSPSLSFPHRWWIMHSISLTDSLFSRLCGIKAYLSHVWQWSSLGGHLGNNFSPFFIGNSAQPLFTGNLSVKKISALSNFLLLHLLFHALHMQLADRRRMGKENKMGWDDTIRKSSFRSEIRLKEDGRKEFIAVFSRKEFPISLSFPCSP